MHNATQKLTERDSLWHMCCLSYSSFVLLYFVMVTTYRPVIECRRGMHRLKFNFYRIVNRSYGHNNNNNNNNNSDVSDREYKCELQWTLTDFLF